jgi:hypothetical protein
MQIRTVLKPILPHVVAVAIFITISVVYFYPALEGKVLRANDSTVSRDAAKEISDFRAKYGKEPLWTNSMFSGMPAYLISTKYTGNLVVYADRVLKFLKLPAASIFLTMAGFYLLLLCFKVDIRLAVAGAIVYGLSTYFFFILAAGHNTKAYALAYMAPMIGGIYYTYRYNAIKGALITGFFLTLELLANHPQITYYSFICILIYLIAELVSAIREKELPAFLKKSAVLIIPVLLAVGMNFASLYTTYEYGKFSTRSKSELISNDVNQTSGLDKDYVTTWSYGVGETFTFLIPNFRGGSSRLFANNSETVSALRKNNAAQAIDQFRVYWGTQPGTDGPVYVGAIVVFLFILGLVILKGPVKWWLLSATVLSVMLAWGKNFMPLTSLFLDFFPGYNKFRAVTMTLVIAEFCMPLLGILALRNIFNGTTTPKEVLRGIKIAFGVAGGLALLFVLFPNLAGSYIDPREEQAQLPGWLTSALIADRKMLLKVDALRSFGFILLAAAGLIAYHYKKLKMETVVIGLAVLFFLDMWFVDKRYLNSGNFVAPSVYQKASAPTIADNLIMKDPSDYRVLNLSVSPFNDASTSLYHKSIGGYHGAKIKRYQDLIDSAIIGDVVLYQTALGKVKTIQDLALLDPLLSKLNSNNALRMLNTKYFIIDGQIAPAVNTLALGNAWFVATPLMVSNPNEEISMINKFDPKNQAIIDKRFKDQITSAVYQPAPGDTISLTSYKPNELTYKYSSQGERLVVFSEIYYPAGWKAYIDGAEKPYFRTDYVLRGMIVPAGNHEITFRFKPASYTTGNTVQLASSLIFILLVAGYSGFLLRNKNSRGENDPS